MTVINRSRLQALLIEEEARFEREHPRSKALFKRAKNSLLGGVPMNWMVRWAGAFPIFVDEASGAYFSDVDGRRYLDLCLLIRRNCESRGMTPPDLPPPSAFTAAAAESVDLAGFGAIIFTSGFRPDYRSWIHADDAFDALGFPITQDGRSTVVRGLYFCGVHFLRKRKSSIFMGIGEDAAIVARSIAGAAAVAIA